MQELLLENEEVNNILKKNDYNKLCCEYTVKEVFQNKDTRFAKVIIKLLHLGLNRNGSVFTKDVVETAIPTLANTPILGSIDTATDDFTGHNSELELDENDDIVVNYRGQAFGVIPESNNAEFVEEEDENGKKREYLVVEGLLWTKFKDALDIIKESNGEKPQSMELALDYEGKFNSDGYFQFTNFKFDGACILGTNVMPAMISSTVSLQFDADIISSEVKNKLLEYQALIKEDNDMPKGKKKTEFQTSLEQKREALGKILPDFEYLVFTYEDYLIAYNYDENQFKKYNYSENENIYTVNFIEQVFESFLTQSELDAIEVRNSNITQMETDFKNLQEEKKDFTSTIDKSNEKLQEALTELENYKTELSKIKPEYEALKTEKNKQDKVKILDKYTLLNEEDKKEVVENLDNLSIEEISFKCNELLIAKQDELIKNFSLNENSKNIPLKIKEQDNVKSNKKLPAYADLMKEEE